MKKLLKNAKWIAGGIVLLAAIVMGANVAFLHAQSDAIYEGIYVGELSLGSLSQEEAEEQIDEYVNEILAQPIEVYVQERRVELSATDLGLEWTNQNLAEKAYAVGRRGNLIRRYKEQQDLKHKSIQLDVCFAINEEQAKESLEANLEDLNQEAIDNGLKRENGEFVFVEGQSGICVDVESSIAKIQESVAALGQKSIEPIELVSEIDEPKGSREELEQVKDLLGAGHTDYSTSAPGRCVNVQNATGFINGTLLYPGDEFSVHDTISPITLENGYDVAGAYENGTVIESIGGGVCQVSSTLYLAVIHSELEVLKRFPHSMVVSYVRPSQDAAIAGNYKDFQFKNSTEYPIYIEGYTVNKQVYFNIYGVETRDANREVSYETEILTETEPETKFNASDAPIGTVTKVQGSHKGYTAKLVKIVKVNGKEVSREDFNKSTYNMSPEIYEVGTRSSNEEAVKAIKAAIKTGDLAEIKRVASYWSDDAIQKRKDQEKKEEDKKPAESDKEPVGDEDEDDEGR